MKKLSILVVIIVIFAIIFVGCEGPMGPMGPAGIDGIDGAPGADVEDGSQLLATLKANESYVPVIGYHFPITNYTPDVDAVAFIYARMSADSNKAGDVFSFRIAYRTPTITGENEVGTSYYLDTHTTAADQSVFQANFDHIDLVAGQSYDFGVHFYNVAAVTGFNFDWLSMEVMIFEK